MPEDADRRRKLTPKQAARFIRAVRRARRMQILSDCFRTTHGLRHNAILDFTWRRMEVGEVSARRRPLHQLCGHLDAAERRRWRRCKASLSQPATHLPWWARKR